MVTYNFKTMKVVPSAKDFIDIVLSKTQRQTPTVVHAGWKISRIRSFYMRKVKFTASTWHDRLTTILEEFPKVDDVHPFYGDLMNVLYDKDHYKLALGQLNVAKGLVDKLAQDYVRLLKYGDSLYRCKQIKRAAMGRMCTLMKKQGPSLAYLEQVRQHMSRLPSIDPSTRTLLVCGYPNVGKSSFMNTVTRADVEVQPYAFTTKSLYVGHLDYKYLRWQCIDTPGILDRPLEERNTIEMQSVTALAHLRATCLYVVDISEECGYTIAAQAALFHSIKPLFANKPVLIVLNKIDVRPQEDLTPEEAQVIAEMGAEAARLSAGGVIVQGEQEATVLSMSTLQETGVQAVKQAACDRLLAHRVEQKMAGKRIHDVLNRMHVAQPARRDSVARPPVIPPGLAAARAKKEAGQKRATERDLQEANGGAGVYSADVRRRYDLEDESWRYDVVPEIMDGHNVADYVDPDIDARLAELEREEDAAAAAFEAERAEEMSEDDLTEEQTELLGAIRHKKSQLIAAHRMKKSTANNQAVLPRNADRERKSTVSNMKRSIVALGMDPTKAVERARSQSRGRKRTRSEAPDGDAEMGEQPKRVHSSKSRSMSRGRSMSVADPSARDGLKDAAMKNRAVKKADQAQQYRNKRAKKGEGDRVILNPKPKHLFSGKRGIGKTDRR